MTHDERIGKNVKALRESFGESQAFLAAYLGVERSAINKYEKGLRSINNDLLCKLATRYSIPVDTIVNGDISDMPHISWNNFTPLIDQLDCYLPIIKNDEAMEDANFKRGVFYQEAFYKAVKKQDIEKDYILMALDEYKNSYKQIKCKELAAGNILAITYFMILLLSQSISMMEKNPAEIDALIKVGILKKESMEELQSAWKDEAEDIRNLFKQFSDRESQNEIFRYIRTLKKSLKWSDLGDYYIGMGYFWPIFVNDNSRMFNCSIGMEMLLAYRRMGNRYALGILKYYEKMVVDKLETHDD